MKKVSVRDSRENFASVTRLEETAAVPFISRASLRNRLPPMRETAAKSVSALRDEEER